MPAKKEVFGKGPFAGLNWIEAECEIMDDALRPNQRTDFIVRIKNLLPFDLNEFGPNDPAFKIRVWTTGPGTRPEIAPAAPPGGYNGAVIRLDRDEEEAVHFLVNNPEQDPTGDYTIWTQIMRTGWPSWTRNLSVHP